MSNVGASRTAAELMQDSLRNHQPTVVQYAGKPIFDASPAAQEIFLAGRNGARLNLPTDSAIIMMVMAMAWNITDGDNPAGAVLFAAVENDGGTVAVFPTNLRATDGNPIVEYTTGVGTWAVAADNTNKAAVLNFTGVASKSYMCQATAYISVAGDLFKLPNLYGTTT